MAATDSKAHERQAHQQLARQRKGNGVASGEALLDIAATWSYWQHPPPKSTIRDIALPETLPERIALVVQGVRRCGKSTLLAQLIERYQLDRRHCLLLNFEDPRLAASLDFTTLELATEAFSALHPRAKTLTFLFDEIQWVDGWHRWLCAKLERPGRFRFVITGSNAHLLSGELSTMLTGRHITVELFPFDFAEFRRLRPKASLADYLHCGGFPEPAVSGQGDSLLRQYFIDVLQRDVRERIGARSSLALQRIAQMVFESTGSELSLRRIAAANGVAVETVATSLDACEESYLLFSCPWFAWSERKRSHRNRKYYPVDPGLRRVAVTRAGADLGKALENATFIELKKRFEDVCYWRDTRGSEVDFVVQTASGPTPIQVTTQNPTDRHLRALDTFHETFPQATEAVQVTLENFPDVFESLT